MPLLNFAIVMLFGLCAMGAPEDQLRSGSGGVHTVEGFAAPFRTATLAAVYPGRITALSVQEGEVVEAGVLMVTLEDGVQRARVAMATAKAQSSLDVELAQARWDRTIADLNRLRRLHGDSDASSKELNDATVDERVRRIEFYLAEFELSQAKRAHDKEVAQLELLHIRAPFDGYVSERLAEVGESVDERDGIVTVVQLDPLLVALDCPLATRVQVKVGDTVVVRPADANGAARSGTITFINRVADGASQTVRVKVTIPNTDARWLAGMKVAVDLPIGPNGSASDQRTGKSVVNGHTWAESNSDRTVSNKQ